MDAKVLWLLSSLQWCSTRWCTESDLVYNLLKQSLELLQSKGRGCYWDNQFSSALCYADDTTVIAPSPDVLRKMIIDCEAFAGSHGLKFSVLKTQLICFCRLSCPVSSCFWFCGQLLLFCDSVLHLGNILQFDLSDKADIQAKTMAFIFQGQFSSLLLSFLWSFY